MCIRDSCIYFHVQYSGLVQGDNSYVYCGSAAGVTACSRLSGTDQKYKCNGGCLLYTSEVTRPAAKRGYNRRCQKARKSYLEAHPLCVQCAKQGKYVRATVVDHIIPHRGDQKLCWDQNNWQSLCKNCHDKKTLTEDINPTYTY